MVWYHVLEDRCVPGSMSQPYASFCWNGFMAWQVRNTIAVARSKHHHMFDRPCRRHSIRLQSQKQKPTFLHGRLGQRPPGRSSLSQRKQASLCPIEIVLDIGAQLANQALQFCFRAVEEFLLQSFLPVNERSVQCHKWFRTVGTVTQSRHCSLFGCPRSCAKTVCRS